MPKYQGSLDAADKAYVFYSKHAMAIKNMPFLKTKMVEDAFSMKDLKVFDNREDLEEELNLLDISNSVVVFMSSGNFEKVDLKGILIEK